MDVFKLIAGVFVGIMVFWLGADFFFPLGKLIYSYIKEYFEGK